MGLGTALAAALGTYALFAAIFLISENRRPQATLAWLLAFLTMPGLGILIYFFFGRSRKAFSKESQLLKQDLSGRVRPLLAPVYSRQDAEITRLSKDSAARRKLMMLVRRNSLSGLTTCNDVDILQDASEFYPRMVQDMKEARRSIHLQYYIWRGDAGSAEMTDVMLEKARRGVQVRLLYDPLGSRKGLSRGYIDALRKAGIVLSPTSPTFRPHTISYRNHRKITVIDGVIGYTGGMNIGKEHLDGGEGFESWRDTQVRIAGDSASMMQAVFMVDWFNATKENLFEPSYFPGASATAADDVPVQILTSGPDSQWAAIRQFYATMIVSAQRRVFLQSPFFIPDTTIEEALRSAALAGVDVRLMLSERPSGDPVPAWATNTFVNNIVASGVRVFLYRKGYLHAKTICVDSEICSIGSANIDIRSFSINYEINAVLYSHRLAAQLEQDFERDLAHCVEFEAEAYESRGRALRFRDSVARLFSPLL